ncbi:hypothetical protein WL84_07015 [Burkholderia cenocepacia]|nr:hypothetical protein WL84_07015 [Burkholderia cenocepacia]
MFAQLSRKYLAPCAQVPLARIQTPPVRTTHPNTQVYVRMRLVIVLCEHVQSSVAEYLARERP